MKHALISPLEPVETGYRVAEVTGAEFQVASPLFWVDCADDVEADKFWYDPNTQTILPVTPPAPPEMGIPVTDTGAIL